MKNASREKQLTTIAHYMGHKSERKNFAYLDNQIPNRVRWLNRNSEGTDKIISSFLFTRSEVEEYQAKLQNKPDWDDIPKQACIMVQNGNGVFAFGTYKNATPCFKTDGWMGEGPGEWLGHLDGNLVGGWTDSLEYRPIPEDQPTPEEEEAFKAMEGKPFNFIGRTKQGKAPVWDGKGLPPSGIICECDFFKRENYVRVKTLDASNGTERVCVTLNEDGSYGQTMWGGKFRPIRTDCEQWCDLVETRTGLHFERESLEAIYDAGLGVLPK